MSAVLTGARTAATIAAIALGADLVPSLPPPLSGPRPVEGMHRPIEGFGAGTTGGAGRPPCAVRSLADRGPGTLRDCLSAGDRHVTFEVAGGIALASTIDVPSNVTIDGSSAPVPGITVTGHGFSVWDTSNIILQGFRIQNVGFRPPSDPAIEEGTVTGNLDCVSVHGAAVSNLVLDHMSIVGCGDGAIDITTGPKDITIQWSILSTWKGVLWGTTRAALPEDTDRISMHHTMMICNDRPVGCDRFPLVRPRGFATRVDLRNNVFEGWIRANGTKIEAAARVNVIGNAYIPRPDATGPQRDGSIVFDPAARVYTSDNVELGAAPRPDLNDNGNQASPMPVHPVTARPLACVVRDAGAHPRDAADERLVTYVRAVPAGCDDPPLPPRPSPAPRPDGVDGVVPTPPRRPDTATTRPPW